MNKESITLCFLPRALAHILYIKVLFYAKKQLKIQIITINNKHLVNIFSGDKIELHAKYMHITHKNIIKLLYYHE